MKIEVNGETPFQVNSDKIIIDATSAGYTLQISVDGENYYDVADMEPVGEGQVLPVGGVIPGIYFRLKDNVDDGVVVRG